MNTDLNSGREIALIGIRLLDDAYMAWQAAELDAEQSLRAWCDGGHEAAYQAYRAAVDREEAAARDLERLHELTGVCMDAILPDEDEAPEAMPGRAAGCSRTRHSPDSSAPLCAYPSAAHTGRAVPTHDKQDEHQR